MESAYQDDKISSGVDRIEVSQKTVVEKINEVLQQIEELKKGVEEIPEKVKKDLVDQINESIVGQSYFSYDTTSIYLPTVSLNFKETGVIKKRGFLN